VKEKEDIFLKNAQNKQTKQPLSNTKLKQLKVPKEKENGKIFNI
jgi:hypothetical protein